MPDDAMVHCTDRPWWWTVIGVNKVVWVVIGGQKVVWVVIEGMSSDKGGVDEGRHD